MKLFYNAKFYSMEKEGDFFSAVLVDNGKIVETFRQIPQLENIEQIDLSGKIVFPGFIDTHTHSFEGGFYSMNANLDNVRNLKEVFAILAETKPVSGKIFAFHFDETQIEERRFPTIDELDRIFPDTPLLLRRVDGHGSVINSAAAKMINWKNTLPNDFDGHLFGRANGEAANWFHKDLSAESIIKAYKNAAEIAVKTGHTTIHTMIGDAYSDSKHFDLIKENLGKLPIKYILYPQITDVDLALEKGSSTVGGCILADGSFGSYSAALNEPYSDKPATHGILYRSSEFWGKFIEKAHKNDLQIAIHCIGDRAINQILTHYERVESQNSKSLKHMIIHNELTSDVVLDRIAAAGVSVAMQPMFDRLWAGVNGLYEKRLGKERTSRTNRLASIYNRGILLAGGSDWYITDLNALKGIDAATRIHNKKERLTSYQAIEIYTRNAAKLSSDDDRIGTIKTGKEANLVVLDADIFSTDSIKNIKVLKTIYRGEIIFESQEMN